MPHFFFHIRDGSGELQDTEGRELADLDRAKAVALAAVRDLLSSDMKTGTLDLRPWLHVQDEAGDIVHHLSFHEAFKVIT